MAYWKGDEAEDGRPVGVRAIERESTGISEFAWAPDGGELVFAYEEKLYLLRREGSDPVAVTDPGAGRDLAFSPDGRYLSYVEDGDLWLTNRGGGERVQASKLARPPIGVVPGARFSRHDVEVVSYRWSPTGGYIALLVEDRTAVRRVGIPEYLAEAPLLPEVRRSFPGDNDEVRAFYIYSVAEGELRPVALEGAQNRWVGTYSWSPEGQRLLIDQHSEDAVDRWIYVTSADAPALTEVFHDHRPTRVSWHWNSIWRSDGQGIVFISDHDGRHRLYSLELESGELRSLTPPEGSVVGESGAAILAASSGARDIVFVAALKSPYERHVYRIPDSGGVVTQVTELEGTHVPVVSPDGRRVALLHSSDSSPTDLYVIDLLEGAAERRVTRSPSEDFQAYPWVRPTYVTFPSHLDGSMLHGRLLVPPDLERERKHPAILGPVYPNTVRNRWGDREEWRGLYSSFQQFLVLEKRYVVLQVDVRGSVGYGRAFREGLLQGYGGIDVDDLESGVEYLKTLGYVDPVRVGIWGSSYGGLLTAMSLMRKPGVYRAGVAAAPATNLWHATPHELRVGRRPESFPEIYRRSSVIHYGEELRDPLLILHGMRDSIVLFQDTVALAERLIRLGRDFDLALAPTAVHTWSEDESVGRYFLGKLVDHFERHLGDGGR